MNLILIVIDTLRYDAVGSHSDGRIETPNIDRLAARSWRFDNHYACSFPTIPHRTDVMTGLSGAPFHMWRPLPFDALTLPRVLADAGYATQLIHDTPHLVNGGHNFDYPFHAWTFVHGAEVDRPWITDTVEYPENWQAESVFDGLGADGQVVPCVPTYARANRNRRTLDDWNAARLFGAAAQFLCDNAKRDNFFLWVDCFDPHEPWDAPREFMMKAVDEPGYDGRVDPRSFWLVHGAQDRALPEAAAKRIRAAYIAKTMWMDDCLGRMLDAMDANDLWRNTAVIFTSDHGTRLGERGRFAKMGAADQEIGHTPLFVCAPEIGTGRSGVIAQPQDIFATACALAGVDLPEGLDAHDVLAAARGGQPSARKVALFGYAPNAWREKKNGTLFVVTDGAWWLEFCARVEHCKLRRCGDSRDVAAGNPDVVKRLHAAGLAELERRGADPAILAWVRSGAEGEFPAEARLCDGWPPPAGYKAYFGHLCKD